jgi:thiosulfate/3-mercaptopyruvate sulfurtransferase
MSYAHPEILVDTKWVQEHLNDPKVRVVEVDYDPTVNYALGHVPGAVLFDWRKDLNHPVQRDIPTKEQVEALLGKAGINADTKIVLYGDFNNWFAAYAFWDLHYYGVKNVVLMNGGRKKWVDEDKPLTKDVASYPKAVFRASDPDENIRTYLKQTLQWYPNAHYGFVDVRSPKEFTGEVLAPPEYPTEHAQRGGHIPGAVNIPWSQAVSEDGTFKPYEELKKLYESKGITPNREIITYCRIGERSSFSWLVLKYLLGYPNVRNYDGSWTEWGNIVRSPIEKPLQAQPVPQSVTA